MSSAVLLRKNLLGFLQNTILPELHRRRAPSIVLANLPLQVPGGVKVREMEHPPLREADAHRIYPDGKLWPDVQMHSAHFPALFCIVEGEADLLMGVTTAMRNQLSARDKRKYTAGGYIFSLPQHSFFLVPPEIPQKTGRIIPWLRQMPHTGRLSFFHVRILPVGALCNVSTLTGEHYEWSYSLLIDDPQLLPVVQVLIDELKSVPNDSQIVQAQLLTLMLRLERGMTVRVPAMTDGLYSRFPDSDPLDLQAQPDRHPVIERTHKFIQLHLHEPLTPAQIAKQGQLSPAQLNRLLKTHTGLSTMNYVTKLRMDSARLLLFSSELSVQEISELVGFRQLPYFSRTFHRHVGCTPLQFRQRQRALQNPI